MALRYVASRFAIPALRRPSGPRVSQSAGSGPLASRSSQVGYYSYNGHAGWKQLHEETNEQLLAKSRALDDAFEAVRRLIERRQRRQKFERRLNIAASVIGFGIAGYIAYLVERDYGWVFEQGALSRDSMEFGGADTGGLEALAHRSDVVDV